MSPESARTLRRSRLAALRRAEPGLSRRELAQRLGVSKDTVRRDLEAMTQDAVPAAAPDAPQVAEAGAAEPSQDAPLPRRVAQPLSDMDVSQWRALRRDLAVLTQSGRSAEAIVHHVVVAVAQSYRKALVRGDIEVGTPFWITEVVMRPVGPSTARPTP